MKQYEYTSSYLLTDEAKNINNITTMMNLYGNNGWHFTGYVKEVQNGTFYFFARVQDTVV